MVKKVCAVFVLWCVWIIVPIESVMMAVRIELAGRLSSTTSTTTMLQLLRQHMRRRHVWPHRRHLVQVRPPRRLWVPWSCTSRLVVVIGLLLIVDPTTIAQQARCNLHHQEISSQHVLGLLSHLTYVCSIL